MGTFFKKNYKSIVKHIYTEVQINNVNRKKQVIALWDTGASGSCISYEVAKELHLIPTGKVCVNTPSGQDITNTYLVDIILPNNIMINSIKVCDTAIGNQGIGALIGMDIITRGDMKIINSSKTTLFSFKFNS